MADEPKKKQTKVGKFGDAETALRIQVIDSEYKVARTNNDQQYSDFESLLDMIELVRSDKNYSWQSDVFIGLLLSHMLTDSSIWAGQDFQTRDFCDVYLEGDNPDDKIKSQCAKMIINKLLNIKDIYYFQKRIRGRTINWLFGQVYALLWWEQETRKKKIPQPPIPIQVPEVDADGNTVTVTKMQEQEPIEQEIIVKDRFNCEFFDARNVFTDYSYTYSAQQKPWIILRSEKSLADLKRDAEKMGYFNLEKLEECLDSSETVTSQETVNKLGGAYGPKQSFSKTTHKMLDVLDRYGSIYAVVTDVDDDGLPIEIEPGTDSNGEPLDGAEIVEAIVTYAGTGDNYTLIGFKPTWAIDYNGTPYKPIIRGWCYIHPTKDIGMSDGKNLRELNVAVNDTFNISNDRVMLATMPTFLGRKLALENNPTVYMEPEHIIELENIEQDLKELKISDNIQGALQQMGFLRSVASESDAIFPTTMGGLPEKTSTTATAVAGAETRTNTRTNLKSLTWTYSFDVEFYQMILQMVYRFVKPETLVKLVGEDLAVKFDPVADYTFVPLSANIEAEHQKMRKVQTYDQIIGRLAGLAKVVPEIIPIIAYMIGEQCKLMGNEYRTVSHLIENLTKAKPREEGGGAESVADSGGTPASNQSGVPQSVMETSARGMQNTAKGATA